MGAAVSRQVATSITKSLTNITANTSIDSQKSCSASAFSSQEVTIVSISNSNIGSINLNAEQQISTTCLQTNSSQATLSSTLSNDLQSAVAQTVKQNGLTLGANVSDSEINQVNETISNFTQNYSISNLSSCVANVVNSQKLNIGTVSGSTIGNITLAIDQSVIAKCVQEDTSFNSMVNDVSNTLATSAQQTVSQGIDLFSGLIVIVIILVVVYLVYKQGIGAITKPQVIIPIVIAVAVLIGIRFL